jgi:signal transduction histidine kinase
LKSKKAFVQYISHEARGPLSVASMGLELHLMDLRSAMKHDVGSAALANSDSRYDWLSRRCVHVNEVMDSCNAAQHILNDLLTYDKIESGMLQMERDVLPILPFLDREFSPYSIQSRYKNITVHYNWKEGKIHSSYDKICVMADKHKLAQVFRNLLSNALKFTPVDGQINVDVKILCLLQAGDGGADSAPLLMDSWMPSPKAAPSPVASTGKGTTTPWSTDVDLTATATSTRASRRQQSDRDNSRVVRYGQSHSNTSASAINNSASTVGGAEDFYVDITEVDFANLDRVVLDMVCRVEVRDSGPGIKKVRRGESYRAVWQRDLTAGARQNANMVCCWFL